MRQVPTWPSGRSRAQICLWVPHFQAHPMWDWSAGPRRSHCGCWGGSALTDRGPDELTGPFQILWPPRCHHGPEGHSFQIILTPVLATHTHTHTHTHIHTHTHTHTHSCHLLLPSSVAFTIGSRQELHSSPWGFLFTSFPPSRHFSHSITLETLSSPCGTRHE